MADRVHLTDDQLRQYDEDGFVLLGSILDDDERRALLEAERRFRPTQAYAAAGRPSKLLVRDQLCHHSSAVRAFCLGGRHLDAVTQALGPDVAFTHTQFITKLPDDGDVDSFIPLHQDDGYGLLEPQLDVTVWTALTDTDEGNGCLVIAPGSHRAGLVTHAKADHNPALREAPDVATIPVPLPAGHAVLFHGLTLHGSGPNRSEAPRVGMHARYCHPSVRMMTEGGKPVLEDAHSWMVRGEAPLAGWTSANEKFTAERV